MLLTGESEALGEQYYKAWVMDSRLRVEQLLKVSDR
jgi:hypothetical protein